MFKAMRNALIAVALIAATANAQYKNPPSAPPAQPGAVQVAPNNNIQVTTATSPDDELSKARRINRSEAIKLVKEKKAVWIDVRGKDAYDQSHIPGAISIPLGELNDNLTKLPPRKFLITYCA
jgi:rhodanese-like protein